MNHKTIVLLVLASAAFAQTKSPNGLKVWFADGTGLDIHTESTGANLPLSTSGSEAVPAGYDFHRLVLDKQGTMLLGYDIEARKTGQGTFTIRIKPVDTDKFMVGGRGKWLEIPTLTGAREFPPLRMGDAVEVDILYHPVTGERIYDVLKVSGDRPPSGRTPKTAGERFSLEDVRVAVNGKTIQEQRNTWMIGGGLMIYLPGRGEFYLALSPPPDFPFQASGWVDHTILRFHAGSELVEITGKSNMLQKAAYGTVWVYHVPESESVSRAVAVARLRQKLGEDRKVSGTHHPKGVALEKQLAEDRPVEFHCSDDVESLIRVYKKKED